MRTICFHKEKMEKYLTKIYPLSIQILEFDPHFYQWYREDIDNPDALETFETNLTQEISILTNRRDEFKKKK